MTMQKRLRGLILAVALSFGAYAAYAENITVSTYYPSPYGAYTDLRTATFTTTGQANLATTASNVVIGAAGAGAAKLDVTGNSRIGGNETVTGTLSVNSGTLNLGTGGTGGALRVSCDGTWCYAVYA